jgi:hypothetical protein
MRPTFYRNRIHEGEAPATAGETVTLPNPLQPATIPAPQVQAASHRRRSSINAYIVHTAETEEEQRRSGDEALVVSAIQDQHAFDTRTRTFVVREKVVRGTLSSAVGDELVAVALGEETVTVTRVEKMWVVAVLFVPPLIMGPVFGCVPLNAPSAGPDVQFLLLLGVIALFLGPGASHLFARMLFFEPTVFTTVRDGIVCALVSCLVYFGLGSAWRFPTPLGYLIAASAMIGALLLLTIHDSFGLRTALQPEMRRQLIAPFILALLPVVFLALFSVYRVAFAQMSASEQFMFAPVWPFLKIALKKVATRLAELASNPDVVPFVLFSFDAVAAMCGSLLFLSASEVDSVLAMISVDLCENMVMAIRVMFHIHEYDKIEGERKLTDLESKVTLEMETIRLEMAAMKMEFQAQLSHRSSTTEESFPSPLEDTTGNNAEEVQLLEPEQPLDDNAVRLHKAVRLLLAFVASEASEIVASTWVMIVTSFIYHGINKPYFYVIKDMDDDAFWKAFSFSALDASLELFAFVVLAVFLQLRTGLAVLPVGLSYIRNQGLHISVVLVSTLINIVALAFFLIHNGVDPTFKFEYDDQE